MGSFEIAADRRRRLRTDLLSIHFGEVRAASIQFVRKITGFNKPSKANEAVFLAAVDEVAAVSIRLLRSLETSAVC